MFLHDRTRLLCPCASCLHLARSLGARGPNFLVVALRAGLTSSFAPFRHSDRVTHATMWLSDSVILANRRRCPPPSLSSRCQMCGQERILKVHIYCFGFNFDINFVLFLCVSFVPLKCSLYQFWFTAIFILSTVSFSSLKRFWVVESFWEVGTQTLCLGVSERFLLKQHPSDQPNKIKCQHQKSCHRPFVWGYFQTKTKNVKVCIS